MNAIVVDAATRRQLGNLESATFFKDESGQIIGEFVPLTVNALEPQVSEEELDRRERAGGGRSLKEIMADLDKRR